MDEQYEEDQTFEGFSLESGVLVDRDFVDCHFVSCTLTDCTLVRCSFSGCRFEKCRISNLKTEGSQMKFSEFSNCDLVGIEWQGLAPNGKFAGPLAKLQACRLTYNTFAELKLNKFDFSGAEITRSIFAKCELVEANFRACKLGETEFFQCDIRKADFREATGYQIDIMENKMKAARFSYPDAICLLDSLELRID